jgi:hypothetical protein
VAVSLLEFASNLPFGLFFGEIGDQGQRYTMAPKDKGQGLMSVPFALHGKSMCPTKGCSIYWGYIIS